MKASSCTTKYQISLPTYGNVTKKKCIKNYSPNALLLFLLLVEFNHVHALLTMSCIKVGCYIFIYLTTVASCLHLLIRGIKLETGIEKIFLPKKKVTKFKGSKISIFCSSMNAKTYSNERKKIDIVSKLNIFSGTAGHDSYIFPYTAHRSHSWQANMLITFMPLHGLVIFATFHIINCLVWLMDWQVMLYRVEF